MSYVAVTFYSTEADNTPQFCKIIWDYHYLVPTSHDSNESLLPGCQANGSSSGKPEMYFWFYILDWKIPTHAASALSMRKEHNIMHRDNVRAQASFIISVNVSIQNHSCLATAKTPLLWEGGAINGSVVTRMGDCDFGYVKFYVYSEGIYLRWPRRAIHFQFGDFPT